MKTVDIDTLNLQASTNVYTVDDIQALADDIEKHGLQNPPKVIGSVVVSGIRRVLACKLLGFRTIQVIEK